MRRNMLFILAIILLSLGVKSSPTHAFWGIWDGIPICRAPGMQGGPVIIPDGSGGAIIAWRDYNGETYDIYAQRVDAAGTVQWGDDGIPICTAAGVQHSPCMIPDGSGGAIIAWADERNGESYNDIYAQRVSGDGVIQWMENGDSVCTSIALVMGMDMISDGSGGAILVWSDSRNGWGPDVYAQRIDGEGNYVWQPDGVEICAIWGYEVHARIAPDGAGGAYITWEDYDCSNPGVYAQHVNSSGVRQWAERGVVVTWDPGSPEIISDDAGGAIIMWAGLLAQRIDADANLLWAPDGAAITTRTYDRYNPDIIPDGSGGAFIAWHDSNVGSRDIFAQRIDGDGNRLWTDEGIAVCTAAWHQNLPQIVTDGAGGAIFTWTDNREGSLHTYNYDVYAQRLNPSGTPLWTADGVPVSTETRFQYEPRIVTDGSWGAIITWVDERSGEYDIYAQRVSDTSDRLWETLLRDYSIFVNRTNITVEWTIAQAGRGMRFFVLRSDESDGEFRKIESAKIENKYPAFVFDDDDIEPEMQYSYRVEVLDEAGRRILFETERVSVPAIPLTLHQNHPNPFNPSTTITYYLPDRRHVTLVIVDTAGRLVAVLVDGEQDRGPRSVVWDGSNANGTPVTSGVYLYSLKAGKETISRKMLLLR